LFALVFLAPFARQQALRLEPAKQRVQSALVDLEPELRERIAQRVAVVLRAQLREHGDRQRSAAQLETQLVDELGGHRPIPCAVHRVAHTVYHTVYGRQEAQGRCRQPTAARLALWANSRPYRANASRREISSFQRVSSDRTTSDRSLSRRRACWRSRSMRACSNCKALIASSISARFSGDTVRGCSADRSANWASILWLAAVAESSSLRAAASC